MFYYTILYYSLPYYTIHYTLNFWPLEALDLTVGSRAPSLKLIGAPLGCSTGMQEPGKAGDRQGPETWAYGNCKNGYQ